MKRNIKKVAVLGSGIMGSRIAAHFANIGVEVLLLDIVPRELNDKEKAKGMTLEHSAVRNRIVNDSWTTALKSNPSPIFSQDYAKRVSTGNFDDDLQKISDCDWIIEVVVERLDIKQQVFEKVEKYRKPGTLITTNTSGIPVNLMLEGRSDDFKAHFCGSHFFNPPRYLRLLEIIPTRETKQEVIDFLMHYGDLYLGKTTVLCKDTPAFIANRIGVFGIMSLFHGIKDLGLTIEEVDKLTGPVLGRPKSATFRTADVVGLDTLVHVANGLAKAVPNDERNALFALPDYIQKMIDDNALGSKTGKGFYKKVRNSDGSSEILTLDLETMEYRSKSRAKFATLEQTKPIENLKERIPVLVSGKDKAGEFYRMSFAALFAYVSHRIPEISDELYRIDSAMRAGFGWELGPFEYWDAIGVDKGLKLCQDAGLEVADWVSKMADNGVNSFYRIEDGKKQYYDIPSGSYKSIPGQDAFIILDQIRKTKTVWENAESVVEDLGDGILNIEFRSKMNTIGSGVIQGIHKGIELAEKDFRGVVVGNQAANFSVGANLGLIFMMAIEQDYDELNFAIKAFQNAMMRVRYSSVPVVVAPHGMTLGGGCEMTLHADAVQAAAETYIGLVEFGVGVIPGGGGTKELTLRAADRYMKDDIELNTLREYYLNIGMAKVAKSATEGFELGILKEGRDRISMNIDRQIADAKARAIVLAEEGYTQKPQRKDIKVLGRQALGMFNIGAHSMVESKFISEHDQKISQKLAYVMTGGDLSEPAYVSEQYLLDLEREAFLSLCGERKTLERIQHMLKIGKPLRN
jgi:3-hydroxyacyl-CoA dehydrogenase